MKLSTRISLCVTIVIIGFVWFFIEYMAYDSSYEIEVNRISDSKITSSEITWLDTLPDESEILLLRLYYHSWIPEYDWILIKIKVPTSETRDWELDDTIFENQEDKSRYRSLEILDSDDDWTTLSFKYICGRDKARTLKSWIREEGTKVFKAKEMAIICLKFLCFLLLAVAIVLPYRKIGQFFKRKTVGK